METIRVELENALNSTHPIRSVDAKEWCYAGNFTIKDKRYAFIGNINEGKVTCRCINTSDYANHWFKMDINWDSGERVITVSKLTELV